MAKIPSCALAEQIRLGRLMRAGYGHQARPVLNRNELIASTLDRVVVPRILECIAVRR